MTGIFQAIGFKDASTLKGPELLYLGPSKADCNKAIDAAVKSKKFASILRQDNFAYAMRKVSLQQIRTRKIDCSPEGNARHLAKLKADKEAAEKKAKDEAAAKLAERQKLLDATRAAQPQPKPEEIAAAAA